MSKIEIDLPRNLTAAELKRLGELVTLLFVVGWDVIAFPKQARTIRARMVKAVEVIIGPIPSAPITQSDTMEGGGKEGKA